MDDAMVTLTKGLYCTTTRPVKSLIKICGRDDVEETFKQDAERTESWLKSHFSKHQQNEVGMSMRTTTQRLSTRPNQLICSKISEEGVKVIQNIQNTLVKKDKYKEQFIVPDTKLHITHLVLFETDKSDEMFHDANKRIKEMNQPMEYKFRSLTSYDGNIVLELEPLELCKVQDILKGTCDEYNIKYDERQNYHVTLFKRKIKQGIAPLLCTEDIITISHELTETLYEVEGIDLCQMSKASNYFPVKSTYTYTHEPKRAISETFDISNRKLDNEQPIETPLSTNHSQDVDIFEKSKEPTTTKSKPMVKLKFQEADEELQDIHNPLSTHRISSSHIDSVNPQPKAKVPLKTTEPIEAIQDIESLKTDQKEKEGKKSRHNYNTRQMDQAQMALITLFLLTLNTVTGNPNNNTEHLQTMMTPLNESRLSDFTTILTINHSREGKDAQHVSECNHHDSKFTQPDTSLFPLLPIVAILIVVLVILMEILWALGEAPVEPSETSERTKGRENIRFKIIDQRTNVMNRQTVQKARIQDPSRNKAKKKYNKRESSELKPSEAIKMVNLVSLEY